MAAVSIGGHKLLLLDSVLRANPERDQPRHKPLSERDHQLSIRAASIHTCNIPHTTNRPTPAGHRDDVVQWHILHCSCADGRWQRDAIAGQNGVRSAGDLCDRSDLQLTAGVHRRAVSYDGEERSAGVHPAGGAGGGSGGTVGGGVGEEFAVCGVWRVRDGWGSALVLSARDFEHAAVRHYSGDGAGQEPKGRRGFLWSCAVISNDL